MLDESKVQVHVICAGITVRCGSDVKLEKMSALYPTVQNLTMRIVFFGGFWYVKLVQSKFTNVVTGNNNI